MVGRFFFFNGQSVLRLATAAPHLSRSIDDRLCLLPEYYYYNTWRKINKIPHDPLPQPNPFFGFGVSLFLFMSWENLFYFLVSLALSFSSHVSTMSRSKIGKWKKFHHHHHLSLCAILSIFDNSSARGWTESCDDLVEIPLHVMNFYPPKRINLLMRFFFDSSHHFLSIFRNSIISSLHVKIKIKFE